MNISVKKRFKESTSFFKIKSVYTIDCKLYYTEVTYLNHNGKPYMLYTETIKENGNLEISYRLIDDSGKISDRTYNDFEACFYDYSKPFDFTLKL